MERWVTRGESVLEKMVVPVKKVLSKGKISIIFASPQRIISIMRKLAFCICTHTHTHTHTHTQKKKKDVDHRIINI